MIVDPIQRRFGYGVKRLAISRPAGGSHLSTLARTATRHEEAFAAMPTLLCVGTALMLALTIQLDSIDSQPLASLKDDTTSPLQIQLWSPIAPAPPEEIQLSIAIPPTRGTSVSQTDPVREIDSPSPQPPTRRELDFDASSVAMQGLTSPAPDTDLSARSVASPRPSSPASNHRTKPADLLASAFRAPQATAIDIPEEPSTAYPRSSRRPGVVAGPEDSPSMDNLSASDNGREFLLAHSEFEAKGSTAPSPSRIPAVSAAGIASANAMDQVVWDDLNRAAYRADWREVPLDELPNCSPPGRQDLLKKRILLAAPFERECSHQDGSYRFVETRNLGAFLMWSRPNPDRPAGQPRAMNVCDVLEHALRCLDGSPIEESIAQ